MTREDDATIENGPADLHRQVDTQDFVFIKTEVLSTRAVAPPSRERLAAYAYENPAQSRIHGINRPARDEIEDPCCRVFLDPIRKDIRHSTRRYVPLGETPRQARDG